MTEAEFLYFVIEDGMAEARLDYAGPEQRGKLEGALRGFEECRGLDAAGILQLLEQARRDEAQARRDEAPDFWTWRCRAAEIGWVANVLSAARMNQGLPVLVTPTATGAFKAADILGVRRAP